MIPSDVPAFVLVILIPIELLRYFIIQPFTLGVRLFANMFAGHLLLLIFTLATWYLASASIGLLYDLPLGVVARITGQHVERAPDATELFYKGPHDSTATFEIGEPRNCPVRKSRKTSVPKWKFASRLIRIWRPFGSLAGMKRVV